MTPNCKNIRPNLIGDFPDIHPSSLIDPSAQIIGNVKVGKNVFIAPLAVIRADEPGSDGRVSPIILEEECNIQDGVIIHSHGGNEVVIGPRTSIAHGVAIHGPCRIDEGCFVAMRSTLYSASLEESVWIGMNATILNGARVGAEAVIGAGAVVAPGVHIPPGSLAVGIPARVVRELDAEGRAAGMQGASTYQVRAQRYREYYQHSNPSLRSPKG